MWALGTPAGLHLFQWGWTHHRPIHLRVQRTARCSKFSLPGAMICHIEAILHELTSLLPGLTFPYLPKRFFKSAALVVEESPLTQKFLPQLLRPISKESSSQKQDTDKILCLKYLRVIPNQTLSLLALEASSTDTAGAGGQPAVLTQVLELPTGWTEPMATSLTMTGQGPLGPWLG